VPLPAATVEAAAASEPLAELASRLADVERERDVLVEELVPKSVEALSPGSELAGLIAQLSSDSPKERKEAVSALFVLSDPRSIPSLVSFLNHNREETTGIKYLFAWYDLFWKLDREAALTFALGEFESNDPERATEAFGELLDHLDRHPASESPMKRLEAVALTNRNALTRTRSKILIQRSHDASEEQKRKQEREAEWEQRRQEIEGQRTEREILLGIERALGIKPPESSD
jgi:hypothetical protein